MLATSKPRISSLSAAFAVVVLYVLTLLLPLHQAAGLQRGIEQIGFARLDTWSVCGSIAQDKTGGTPAAVKCPAAGIAKHEFAAILPSPPVVVATAIAVAVIYAPQPLGFAFHLFRHSAQARAPPVLG